MWRVAIAGSLLLSSCAAVPQPNPPVWPDSVHVFGPDDKVEAIREAVKEAISQNGGHQPANHGEFSSARYAFLFKPGTYKVDVPVGYYTQVLGLGASPEDVVFDSNRGVYSEEGNQEDTSGALSTFWRGAENFRTTSQVMLWATSQASPLRRVVVDGDLQLAQFVDGVGMGFASGGYLGNVKVEGLTQAASQQQYFMRNCAIIGDMTGGVWNLVFVGTMGAPASHCSRSSGMAGTVTVDATPVVAEKPFVSYDSGAFFLNVPAVSRQRVGPDFSGGLKVGFQHVYVATEKDSAETINEQLRNGLHVVLTPGIYNLEAPIELVKDNQVLLGLGYATLVAAQGTAAVRVGAAEGVRVAGVLLQAGEQRSDALLEWGNGSFPGNARNPGFLHDVFVRVGGDTDPTQKEVKADVMARIASGHVIGDNLWLWRADHGIAGETEGGRNPVKNGLVVAGDNVTMYGLFVEHALEDLVQWSGENGSVYFFQSEFPYDADASYGDAGYVGYRVNDAVLNHQAYGVGIYHFFRDDAVVVQRGIAAPEWLANSFESPFTVGLSGRGKVLHVINDRGGSTDGSVSTQVEWSCERGPVVLPPTTTKPTTSSTVTKTRTTTTRTTTTVTATTASVTATVSNTFSSMTATSSSVTDTTSTTITATETTASTTTTTITQTDTTTRTGTTVTATFTTWTTTATMTSTHQAALWVQLLGMASPSSSSAGAAHAVELALAVQACLACVVCTLCCLRAQKADRSNEGLSRWSRPLPMDSPPRGSRPAFDSMASMNSVDRSMMDTSMMSADQFGPRLPRTQTLSSMVGKTRSVSQSILSRISAYGRSGGSRPGGAAASHSRANRGTARELSVSSLDISGLGDSRLMDSPSAMMSPHGTP